MVKRVMKKGNPPILSNSGQAQKNDLQSHKRSNNELENGYHSD